MKRLVIAAVCLAACGGGPKSKPTGQVATTPAPTVVDVGPPKPLAVIAARGPYRSLEAACEDLRGDQPEESFRCEAANGTVESRPTDSSKIRSVTLLTVSDLEPTRYCVVAITTDDGVFVYDEDNLLCEDSEYREIASARIDWIELGAGDGAEPVVKLNTTARVRDEAGSEGRGLADGTQRQLLVCGLREGKPVCAHSITVGCDLVACGHHPDEAGAFTLSWEISGGVLEIRPGQGRPSKNAAKSIGRHTLP